MTADEAESAFGDLDLDTERQHVKNMWRQLVVGEKTRQTALACWLKCGEKTTYPFMVNPMFLRGNKNICFGDCMNINFEQGPFLKDLGDVPEDSIPVKFIWGSSKLNDDELLEELNPPKEEGGDGEEGGDEDGDGGDDDDE